MNILLILVDQWRADCLGSLKKIPVKTPNIDRLASQGVLFTNAYTPTPVCAPARQALMSGRQPDSFGALWNYGLGGISSLKPDDDYWMKNLRKAGYKNAYFGQWHSSETAKADEFGYDYYYSDAECKNKIREKYGDINYNNGWFGDTSPVLYEDAVPHSLARAAGEWISNQNGPWHVWFDLAHPHLPCRPSEPFASMYSPDDTVPWDSFGDTLQNKPYIQQQQIHNWHLENMTWEDFAPCVARYYAMISQIDDAVGTLLSLLEDKGIIDDTLIVFTSDHGDTSGGHGMMDKHYILYDDVTRVPLIVRYPKIFEKGYVCDEFVSNCLDFAPTIESLTGISPAGIRHGVSLMDTIAGKNPEKFSVSTSNGQQFGLFTQRSIRDHRFKLIWNLTDINEFYDLETDPGEKVNLINSEEYSSVINDMGEQLKTALKRRNDPFCNGWVDWQISKR